MTDANPAGPPGIQVWVDRGGTFTDCIARDPSTGRVRVVKVPSSDEAPEIGVRKLLGIPPGEAIVPCDLRLGTTLATNALLERKGARTGVMTTRGLGDALAIGDQRRRSLFALHQPATPPLAAVTVEVAARGSHRGTVVDDLDPAETESALDALAQAGVASVAVVVVHGHRSPVLEEALVAAARARGFPGQVVASHEVAEVPGFVPRGQTTIVDAYLTPLLSSYVAYLAQAFPGSRIRIMQSGGGLTEASRFRGRDAVLSGPAGGAVAAGWVARSVGHPGDVVGFDMGGTSTDVSRTEAGRAVTVQETEVAGVQLRTPMVAVHTVAAGGGSLCRFDGLALSVGPESAGADPGPLCYGRAKAREPTLTDASLLLGRLPSDRFPLPLDRGAAEAGFRRLADRVRAAQGRAFTAEEVAIGCFEIAVDHMASAVREVTVARGHDVRGDGMVVFGGAGGQFACAVARHLGIRTLLFHPLAGALSALGMGVAPSSWHGQRDPGGRRALDAPDVGVAVGGLLDVLREEGLSALEADGADPTTVEVFPELDLRYDGTETTLPVPVATPFDPAALRAAFETQHRARFGYHRPEHPVLVATVRATARAPGILPDGVAVEPEPEPPEAPGGTPGSPDRTAEVWFPGGRRRTPVRARESLPRGTPLPGPLLVLEATGTIAVDPGFVATLREDGILVLRACRGIPLTDAAEGEAPQAADDAAPRNAGPPEAEVDPVLLEVFGHRFTSIATQMGHVLQRTAMSPNIRERLDFSCAVFDGEGGLVANAPHIPVHLGAMSESVRSVLAAHPDPQPGDAYLTNDPAGGGSHLPDLTVVTPVFLEAQGEPSEVPGPPSFFVASRGHHADVGGTSPGSMPADSRTLEEEGVVFSAVRIVRGGRFDREGVVARLEGAPHPARRIPENLADLEAQLAANRRGAALLGELCREEGASRVQAYMAHVQRHAAAAVRRAIAALPDGHRRFEDRMDDGSPVAVTVTVTGERLRIDFTGTAPAVEGNLNAPRAVTVAAVLYVLRALVGEPIPLNRGCLEPVELTIPPGSLLDPPSGAAVAAGNVETSQRVVDVLLGALGVAAASQGTMNNLTLGDATFGYYETIAGGAGGTPAGPGASGIHTHMTNSRITDPEVLEESVPVRLRRFAYRRGSGGSGRHPGGDGLVRELEALAPLSATILSERRRTAPFGLAGGAPGAVGRNTVDGADVGGRATLELAPGQRLRIETPGGGGFGAPDTGSRGEGGGTP
jgi:5-oxoprolinase (ATP-hydrolysing)